MFGSLYDYKKNADSVMAKMDKLFGDAAAGRTGNLLFQVLPPSDIDFYANLKLNQYDFDSDAGIQTYIEDLCGAYEHSFDLRKDIMDDALPMLSPVLGIGDYSAFVGGDISFAADTSWSKPMLDSVEGYKRLEPLGTAPWYRKFLDICERLLIASGKSGLPFMRGFFSPMDLAGALRGENLYYDFYDTPKALHGLLDYCADATIQFAEDIYRLAQKYLDGTRHGLWFFDGKINMSEDISCMISADQYREFSAPYTQKVIDHFGTGHMHTHSRAMYLVKEICSLRNVTKLWLATDPNQPRPIEHLSELVEDAGSVCLAIDCERFEEIENNLDQLHKGNFSLCLPVKTTEEAVAVTQRFNALNA